MALQNIKTYFETTNINDFNELLKNTLVVSCKENKGWSIRVL